jgi:hypothetical protein
MILMNKHTREIIHLSDGAYEVLNAFIEPLQCYYKADYVEVNSDEEVKNE